MVLKLARVGGKVTNCIRLLKLCADSVITENGFGLYKSGNTMNVHWLATRQGIIDILSKVPSYLLQIVYRQGQGSNIALGFIYYFLNKYVKSTKFSK